MTNQELHDRQEWHDRIGTLFSKAVFLEAALIHAKNPKALELRRKCRLLFVRWVDLSNYSQRSQSYDLDTLRTILGEVNFFGDLAQLESESNAND